MLFFYRITEYTTSANARLQMIRMTTFLVQASLHIASNVTLTAHVSMEKNLMSPVNQNQKLFVIM